MSCTTVPDIQVVPVERLHKALRLNEPCPLPNTSLNKPLHEWRMETDDAVILRYLFQQLQPHRHLEFGTWQGAGALLCLQNCRATVWSVNLREGLQTDDGDWAYYTDQPHGEPGSGCELKNQANNGHHYAALPAWANTKATPSGKTLYQTDALGFVGRLVHDRGYGHRFCQVYCDSRDWDVSQYPADFFDTALIDGGHDPQIVASDTRKALSVVRPGGVILWHDYCLDGKVLKTCDSVRGVVGGIESVRESLAAQCEDLFWVRPSWLLVGVKRAEMKASDQGDGA